MTVLSTFEILLKPQLPKDLTEKIPALGKVTRVILQGYFLTVSNLSDKGVGLSVTFVTITPGLDPSKILARFDVIGQNGPASLTQDPPPANQPSPKKGDVVRTKFSIFLNPHDTGLLIVQPDASKPNVLKAVDFELRGYVELSLSASNMQQASDVLVTAEHRGTFFDGSNLDNTAALGELSYALPLANGGSLISLTRS
ncbi:hypothetical protein [Synechococcus sp. MW101C3]|uniref:hypothetical protein n=1 Tax=Synechococcus sp. MW101C3 TaxID=210768 RepID=UPI001181B813|nr:hypothetical protein [Synechococcus sp. MW101C3]